MNRLKIDLHRIGQDQAVTVNWLQCGVVDAVIDQLLERKSKRIELVLDGRPKTLTDSLDKPSELAKHLLEAMFSLESEEHHSDEN